MMYLIGNPRKFLIISSKICTHAARNSEKNRFLFETIILNMYKHLGNRSLYLGVHKINLIAESQKTHLVISPKVIKLVHNLIAEL